MHVVPDTGSDWMLVEGHKCDNCAGDKFNADISGVKEPVTKRSERKYGSVIFWGSEYRDKVCLVDSPDACEDKFRFFLIEKSKARHHYKGILEPVDGIMGLSRPELPELLYNRKKLKNKKGYKTGDNLFLTIADREINGEKKQKIFSFYFAAMGEQSFIDYYGYLLYNVRGQSEKNIKWLDVHTPDYYWSVECYGVSFGKPSEMASKSGEKPGNSYRFEEESLYTLFDTGASYIGFPKPYWDHFVENLIAAASVNKPFT